MNTTVSKPRRARRDKLEGRSLLSIYVSGEMYDDLDRYARDTGLSLSQIGRMALRVFLAQDATDDGKEATNESDNPAA